MKKRMLFLLIFAGIACLIFISNQKSEAAEPIFFADFDGKGIPNNSVNEPANWKPENPGTRWDIAEFPANGTKALKQLAEGCDKSGFTPFPTVGSDWTDGIIQVDLGWGDDDSWGIMFRRDGEKKGYFAFFGYIETASLALLDLGEGSGLNGQCLDQLGFEIAGKVNPDKAIKAVDHNLPQPLEKAPNTSYTARILAQGPKIKIWYGLTENFPDNPLKEPDPNKIASMIEVEDSTYTKGSVGIWHESMSNSFIDNVIVYGKEAVSIDPQEKAAITWGSLKSQ